MRVYVLFLCAFLAVANTVTDTDVEAAAQETVSSAYIGSNKMIIKIEYTTATVTIPSVDKRSSNDYIKAFILSLHQQTLK